MKKLLIFLLSLSALASHGQTPMTFTVLTTDNVAPGRGMQHWLTTPIDDLSGVKVPAGNTTMSVYFARFNWADIENTNTQGSFNWTTFDNQFHAAMDAGAMFYFRVMGMCSGCSISGSPYLYPTFVHNQMQSDVANARDWSSGGTWIPNWNSPSWINGYSLLMRAIANHIATSTYNGHSFTSALWAVDQGFYGDFGEGHTYPFGPSTPTGRVVTSASMKALTDTMRACFPNVHLTTPMSYFDPTTPINSHYTALPLDYCYYLLTVTNNVGEIGWRRDNIGDPGYWAYITGNPGVYSGVSLATLAMNKWKVAPVGGEPANDWGAISRAGPPMYDLMNEVTTEHLSFCGNGNYPIALNDNSSRTGGDGVLRTNPGNTIKANVIAAAAFMGYKDVLVSGTRTTNPLAGGSFSVTLNWQNQGNAPVYDTWQVKYQLRNPSTHAVVWQFVSSYDLKTLLPTGTTTSVGITQTLTGVAAGTYDLYLIITDPAGYKAPFPIWITGRQADGSYLLSPSVVVGSGGPPPPPTGCGDCSPLKYANRIP